MTAPNLIRAIHGARRAAALDEDSYRGLLERETGEASLRAMNDEQKRKALSALNALTGPMKKGLTGPYAGKLQALWISGWNLGVIRDPRDEAMLRFIERQTGIQRTEFLRDAADARKAVEAVKGWLAREAHVDWSTSEHRHAFRNDPRFQVVVAQIAKLVGLKRIDPGTNVIVTMRWYAGVKKNPAAFTDEDWMNLSNRLGEMIRRA